MLVLCACVLTLLGATSATLDPKESGGAEHRKRHRKGSNDISLKSHGFVRDESGGFITLDVPATALTTGNGISKQGQIVGTFIDTGDVAHGYMLDDDGFITIDPPGATATEAIGIDRRHEIVGLFTDARGILHGFLAKCDTKKSSRRGIESSSLGGRTCNGGGHAK